MEADTERMRGGRPWCFTNIRSGEGVERVEAFLSQQLPASNA
jgi:urease accessory protein